MKKLAISAIIATSIVAAAVALNWLRQGGYDSQKETWIGVAEAYSFDYDGRRDTYRQVFLISDRHLTVMTWTDYAKQHDEALYSIAEVDDTNGEGFVEDTPSEDVEWVHELPMLDRRRFDEICSSMASSSRSTKTYVGKAVAERTDKTGPTWTGDWSWSEKEYFRFFAISSAGRVVSTYCHAAIPSDVRIVTDWIGSVCPLEYRIRVGEEKEPSQ